MRNSVLFVSSANSCRTQMAEGLLRAFRAPHASVSSAGVKPRPVDPLAIRVMAEIGIDISLHTSKAIGGHRSEAELVVTLGDDEAAFSEVTGGRREHWQVRHPAPAAGALEAGLDEYRSVRDELVQRVAELAASMDVEPAVGVIGGSGFYDLPGLTDVRSVEVTTPFGDPSGPLVEGRLSGRRVVFLARHGEGHKYLPGEVNARANIYALKRLGVARVISISAVGSLREEIAPGDVVLPSQFIDRTMGRPATFFGAGVVAHVSLADPICSDLSRVLSEAGHASGARVHEGRTYVCIDGPQFSTRAESLLWRSHGADVVGMTNLPEAKLAREAELCYATLTIPTDYDSWRPHDEVSVRDVLATLRANIEKARTILGEALSKLEPAPCVCQRTLDDALITPLAAIDASARVRLHPILQRRLDPKKQRHAGG